MTRMAFTFGGALLEAMQSGAVFWPSQAALIVSDLHLGKSARLSAVGGAQLPPYETQDTLFRLESDLNATGARRVLCLGDSFDAPGLDAFLPEHEQTWITRLQAGRQWDWVEGNHDPGPVSLGGTHRAEVEIEGLVLRHMAQPGATAEVSGHYHPKIRLRTRALRCFAMDENRLILPAYGSYTGGLCISSAAFDPWLSGAAKLLLTGPQMAWLPRPPSRRKG